MDKQAEPSAPLEAQAWLLAYYDALVRKSGQESGKMRPIRSPINEEQRSRAAPR